MVHLIKNIIGREILNANGKPTVEAELVTYSGICVTASVPSGKSRGNMKLTNCMTEENVTADMVQKGLRKHIQ